MSVPFNRDEDNEEAENFYDSFQIYKYVVFCIDYTNPDTSKSCLTMISDMIESVKKDRKSSYSIILLGDTNEPINIVLDSNDDLAEGINKIKSYIRETTIHENPLSLKEGIEKAVELAIQNAKKNQQKIIVLMSDNEKPNLTPKESEDLTTWDCVGNFLLNNITFILSPLSDKDLTGSDFYSSLLSLIDCSELIDDREHIAACLSSYGKLNKLELFYDDSNSILFFSEKLFAEKKNLAKNYIDLKNTDFGKVKVLRGNLKEEMKNEPRSYSFKEFYVPSTSGETPTSFVPKKNLKKVFKKDQYEGIFTMQELKMIDEISHKPGRKSRSLELLYVANQSLFEPFMMYNGPSQMLTPNKDHPRSLALSYSFWEHLESKKQLLVCLYATKKAQVAYVRPVTFNGERCFIMSPVGYLEDYNLINPKTYCDREEDKKPEEDYVELVELQHKIIDTLRTNISTLNINDPRAVHLNSLFEAKRNNIPLDHARFVDETSKEYHNVRRKVREFVTDFKVLTYREPVYKPKAVKRKREEYC